MLLAVVTAGTPKVAVAVAEPPPPPKLNNPAVADVVEGPVEVCDKEEDFVPKPKTFDDAEVVAAAVVFGAEEFPKENKFAGAAAAGDAMATICLVAPPLLKEEFLTGAEFRSPFKLFGDFESSLSEIIK